MKKRRSGRVGSAYCRKCKHRHNHNSKAFKDHYVYLVNFKED